MKTAVVIAALSLVALSLAAASPTASAFGWCSEFGTGSNYCYTYIVCIGPSQWGCQYGIEDPCHGTTRCFDPGPDARPILLP